MREIKFRGKRVDNGQWIEGSYHYGKIAESHFINGWEVEAETVGQFTGLHDKNGAEVYEGDLYTAFGSNPYEIRFVNGSFCGGIFGGDDSMFSPLGWASPDDDEELYASDELFKIMEVIGNVHEGGLTCS